MKHYFALVHKDDDSAYGVQFPDIPGVFSAADEINDIIKEAVDALQLYAEDAELPVASSHADIIARDDVKAELAKGAFLISVPYIEDDSAVVRANISFERGILKAIDATAKARGLSRSGFLAQAARHEIEAGA
ncbi:type II toxin-antitoxin system HicB family antitoxin [Brucella intermedia]|uniref:type II toxin-antitoxin system HicB family antitoxin n=1 Tax=Brucella intermedia TaxID=94625 RepID=UPI00235DC9E9|nr:type II toxin-antitoxin system HicB family antitoxin [Brucella intermedia]